VCSAFNRPLKRRRQAGQSAVEFVVVFPALVLLVFGIIQAALLYQGRSTLAYATLLAARAGEATPGGFAQALAKAAAETAGPANLASIEILNPTPASFQDFGRTRIDGGGGKELPNDTLAYRASAAGGSSHQSVQDANLLHVRVTYCLRLIVPVIDRMLQAAFNSPAPAGATGTGMAAPFGIGAVPAGAVCSNPAFGGRRIYVQSEAIVRMQSPFFEANLGGSTQPGQPGAGAPGDPGTPADPSNPDNPVDPGTPIDPTNPGGPQCF
jgi:hypothetical protein